MKGQNLKPLTVSVLFFALSRERIFNKTHSSGSRCYSTGKYTVCRRIRASFSPEILQAVAAKGLIILKPLGGLRRLESTVFTCYSMDFILPLFKGGVNLISTSEPVWPSGKALGW